MQHRAMYLLSCLGLLSLSPSPLTAATVYVDRDATGAAADGASWATAYPTVAQGLAAVTVGDEVWVAEGLYLETVTLAPGVGLYGGFAGTETERSQRDPGTHATILDGNKSGTVVTAPPAAPATTVLDGFTIRSGNPYGVHSQAGSAAVIRNNTVTGSQSTGIVCLAGGGIVEDNTITHNAGGISAAGGTTVRNNIIRWNEFGGVRITGSDPTATSIISGNLIADSPNGSGVSVQTAPAQISGNRIERTKRGLDLGSSTVSNPRIVVRVLSNLLRGLRETSIAVAPTADTTILGNVVAGGDRGIWVQPGGTHLIANNTITGHARDAVNIVAFPGKLTSVSMVNNIIAYNGAAVYAYDDGQYDFRRNCYWANGNPDPTDKGYLKPAPGDIVADPLLADPAHGDLHIAPNSPCLDAGEDLPVVTELLDMDGQPRPQGASVDIGADESDGTAPVAPTVPVVYVRPGGDDGADGTSWATAKRTVQAGIDASSFGEVWIAGGTFPERITVPPFVHLYGGFAGTEAERTGARTNETVLDGAQVGSVVAVQSGNLVNILDGLTISNGSTQFGGGVLAHGGVVLENCVVTGNTAEYGGGLYADAGTPLVRGSRIERNTATKGSSGVHQARGASNTTFERNLIRWNTSDAPYGAIYSDKAALMLRGNVLAGNEGGCVTAWGPLEMVNNTVVANSGRFNAGVDASIGPAVFVNNIVAFNTGGGAYNLGGKGPVFRNNCLFGNTGSMYPAPETGTGNIVADPLFVNRAGDPHLRDGSPCVDAGDDSFPNAGDLDMDGQPRRIGTHVDIGADENLYDSLLLSEVASVLRAVAGLEPVSPEMLDRWNVERADSPDTVTLTDVIQLARRAVGLE